MTGVQTCALPISGVGTLVVWALGEAGVKLEPEAASAIAGAIAAIALFIAVYPANLYMAWDWRDRSAGDRAVAYFRLPFQFLFIWWAWRVSRRAERAPTVD